MAFGPTSPVTGAPQTGLTSPTYTLTSDAFGGNKPSEQYAITALGGTQTGVAAHSVSLPFTLTMERPAQFRQLGTPNPVTGVIGSVPMNVYKIRVRKGVSVDSTQPNKIAQAEIKLSIPAGSDSEDAVSIRAMVSCLFGAVYQDSAGIGDTLIDGVL